MEENINKQEIIDNFENLTVLDVWDTVVKTEEYVYDWFVYNDKKIYVLNNSIFEKEDTNHNENKKKYYLARAVTTKDGDILGFLEDKDYFEALEYYLELKRLFLRDGEI